MKLQYKNKLMKKHYALNYTLAISSLYNYFVYLFIPKVSSSSLFNLLTKSRLFKLKFLKLNMTRFRYLFNLKNFNLGGNVYMIVSSNYSSVVNFIKEIEIIGISFFFLFNFFFNSHFYSKSLKATNSEQSNLSLSLFIKRANLKFINIIHNSILKFLFILKEYAYVKSIS